MGDNPWKIEPRVGDIVETEPHHVSSDNTVLGTNPTNWGQKFVVIQRDGIDHLLSEGEFEAVRLGKGPFNIRSANEAWQAEIVEKTSGRLTVKCLPKSEWPEEEEEFSFDGPERTARITWDGSPQKLDSEQLRKRQEVFTEEDPRGSKNDLLGGHL